MAIAKSAADDLNSAVPVTGRNLTHCLVCQRPVRKLIAQVNTPKVLKPTSISDAKKAGFTVLERRDKGVYEKQ